MADLAKLLEWKSALEGALYKGVRSYEIAGRKMEFRSVTEMRVALNDLNRQIASARGAAPVSMIRVSSSKGD